MSKNIKKSLFVLLGLTILIFLDLLSKNIALNFLEERIPLLGNYVFLELFKNPGIAFSLPLIGSPLKIVTLILIFLIVYYYIKSEHKKNDLFISSAFTLVIAGALGNGYERIVNGEVIDFIGVQYFSVFNFADIYISLGALLYFLSLYLGDKKTHLDQNK